MGLANFKTLIGGDWGIYQTVASMKAQIYTSMRDPSARLRLRAESILSPTTERNEDDEIQAIFYFVQDRFHYVHDPVGIEMLKSPLYVDNEIEQAGSFMGDCDDATAYLATLLLSVGYPAALVIVSPAGSSTSDYKHIYLRAWMAKRKLWVGLDPTAKNKPFGWEVPNQRERMYVL